MAENIGMPRVAVSYGVHHPDALSAHKPLRIIDCFSELQDFV
jgi:phosphoglycolate phosphatase